MDKIFSIYDEKAQVFNTPFVGSNEAVAVRSFADICLDGTNMVSKYPGDFKLYYVGNFDAVKGTITALDVPEFVVSAMQVVNSHLSSREESDGQDISSAVHM